MEKTRGQIGTFVYGLVFVMVAVIVLVMMMTYINGSSGNFTAGTIQRTVVDNIMPFAMIGLLIAIVGLFIGLRGK
jgi:hypothetical protein